MNRNKKGMFGTTGTMVIFVVAMLALYYFVINKPESNTEEKVPTTEIEKLLTKDIVNDYPQNPMEVVKLYNRYSKCLYNEPLSDEDIGKMIDQMRLLFAAEFLENNPRENQLKNFLEEKKEYKKVKRMLSSYTVQKNSQTEYSTTETGEMASIGASLLLTEKSGYEKIYHKYILRKEEDVWKIVGFKNVESLDISGEN